MPEGPELKRASNKLQPLVGKLVQNVVVLSGRYSREKVISNLSALENAVITSISCYGKLIYIQFSNGNEDLVLLSTFGMTGKWLINPSDTKHERIRLYFADGTVASFVDMRNFGTFKIVTQTELEKKLKSFGPDILNSPSTWLDKEIPMFLARLAKYGKFKPISEALMDQRIASGCGNYIRADAMYLARVSPHRMVKTLSDGEIKKLWISMNNIAISSFHNHYPMLGLDYSDQEQETCAGSPFDNLVYGKHQSPKGCIIRRYKDSNGRTVWFSPGEQV